MEKTNRNLWISALLLIVIIGVYAYMTDMHYNLSYGMSEGASVCNVNATFNCDAVDSSSYSKLFGIPIALWALMTNAGLLILVLAAIFTADERRLQYQKIAMALSAYLAFMSVVMAVISVTQLNTFCLFCILQYALSLLNFAVLFTAIPRAQRIFGSADFRPLLKGGETGLRFALVVIILIPFATVLGHASIVNGRETSLFGPGNRFNPQSYVTEWNANTPYTFDETKGLTRGATNAKVTIVEFADYLCPHCRASSPMFDAFALAHPEAHFVFFVFPLDGQCNEGISPHDGKRCELAQAVYCASKQNKGWEAQHWVFSKYEPGTDWKTMASELNMDKAAFEQCSTSPEAHEAVLAQAKIGRETKIEGTPTVFVNGKQLPMGQIRVVLEEAVKKIN
jgi:protein-disulfide isomerase/uncharacterized membrane protein